MKIQNQRRNTILFLIFTAGILILITMAGLLLKEQAVETDFGRKNLSPSLQFLFGTDWMGRDMFARTLAGLSLSIRIGLLTAAVSAVIALILELPLQFLGKRRIPSFPGGSI